MRESTRLVHSPAIVLNLDGMMTSSMQRVMQAVNKDLGSLGQKVLELNPRHNLIKRLSSLQEADPNLARNIAEQVFDNARLSAGLVVEPRAMVERIYRIMEQALAGREQ